MVARNSPRINILGIRSRIRISPKSISSVLSSFFWAGGSRAEIDVGAGTYGNFDMGRGLLEGRSPSSRDGGLSSSELPRSAEKASLISITNSPGNLSGIPEIGSLRNQLKTGVLRLPKRS